MHAPTMGRIDRPYTMALSNTAPTMSTQPVAAGIKHIRIVASQNCWYDYRAGAPPVSNGANNTAPSGIFLPATYVEVIEVSHGEIVQAILDTATSGSLSISEITR